jgi:glycine/D-amino acid oxidase-like deaminating enzyme
VQAEEHTGSYYAATVGDVTDYPPLAGEQRADVCVVGAGFTGLSTALFLAERGYDVRIVEANRIGWGASGRNGGQVISGISGEAAVAKHWGRDVEELFGELRWAGHAIIRERIDTYGIDCDFKYGYLDVAIKPRHLRDLEADQARLAAANFPHEVRLVSRDETRELTGTDKYLGGLVNMGNGHLHPLKLCVGEARAAVQNGARFHERSPVLAIEEGSRPRVVTAGGAVTADAVVIAGNAYHDLHPRLRGILFPVRSYIVATEPLSPEVVASINPRDLAVCDPNFVLQYFRLSVDKRLLFGARFNYLGADPAVIERHHRRALRLRVGRQHRRARQSRAAVRQAVAERLLLPGLFGSRGQRHASRRSDPGGRHRRHPRTLRPVRERETGARALRPRAQEAHGLARRPLLPAEGPVVGKFPDEA